jgi:hypothetical protein
MAKKKQTQKRIDTAAVYSVRQNFLSSAIADISNYIQLMDTKVSIIMAAQGVIIAGLLSLYNEIKDTMSYCNSVLEKTTLFTATVGVMVTTVLVYMYGMRTLKARYAKLDCATSWFVSAESAKKGYEQYLQDFMSKEDGDLIGDMAAELYKINDINRQKMLDVNKTVKAFSVSLIFLRACG